MQGIEVIELQCSEFEGYKEVMRSLLKDFDPNKDKTENLDEQLEKMKFATQTNVYIFHLKGDPVGMYVGATKITPFNTSLYVDCVVTKREYRGRGIGSYMISHMKSVATQKQYDQIELTSSKGDAQIMYKKSGFDEVTGFRFKL